MTHSDGSVSRAMTEFRVVWQREGRRRQMRIFQSWDAACRKFAGIVATDAAKVGTTMDTLPDLVGPPFIEQRRCEPWETAPFQPDAEPRESVVRELSYRFTPRGHAEYEPDEVPF